MTDLIRLAERVEALAGPDREVDAEIALAVLGGRIERVQDGNTGEIFPVRVYADKAGVAVELQAGILRYTASLDAAMTLVPEGWNWCVCFDERPGFANVHKLVKGEGPSNIAIAATPALALTAASLRSIAAQRGQG